MVFYSGCRGGSGFGVHNWYTRPAPRPLPPLVRTRLVLCSNSLLKTLCSISSLLCRKGVFLYPLEPCSPYNCTLFGAHVKIGIYPYEQFSVLFYTVEHSFSVSVFRCVPRRVLIFRLSQFRLVAAWSRVKLLSRSFSRRMG